jgi:hypothetical protein
MDVQKFLYRFEEGYHDTFIRLTLSPFLLELFICSLQFHVQVLGFLLKLGSELPGYTRNDRKPMIQSPDR